MRKGKKKALKNERIKRINKIRDFKVKGRKNAKIKASELRELELTTELLLLYKR